ncbi:nitrate- and nitrite sensing domain-containing protein [Streptomyces sp. NPDC091292]|uniref:nitrate- and nitrite sensing domain-containing protein n=1 Tax=Streptomyces sp. NPDC091292 TaxID=3365991 RepID=UPI0038289D03
MQGRFKRDGSAAAEPEPRGGTDRGSSPQHAQNPGPVSSGSPGDRGDGAPRPSGAGVSAPPPPKAKPKAPTGPGSRILLRNWRISTRLVSLLALPVVAATSLGALRISQSMDDIQQLDNMKLLTDMTKQATELAVALQDERDKSAGPLAHGAKPDDFDVKGPRERTDRARQSFLEGTQQIDDAGDREGILGVRTSILTISGQLANLKGIREEAYKDPSSSSQTVDAYSQLIEQLLALSQDMAQATSNPEMIQRTRALAAFSSAKEYASVQRAVIAAALPPNNTDVGKLSETDRRYALNAFGKEDSQLGSFKGIYGTGAAELLKPIDDGNPTIKDASTYAQRVLLQENGMKSREKRSYKDWIDADSTKIQAMSTIELTLLNEMEQKARELRNESERGAIISGALILVVLGVSLVGAFVVARSMIRSLRRLQDTATKVAQDRLPELVKQLSEADPQDVDTSVESVGVHSRDEIGQVAAAFDDVHREAVRLAAEQALLRGNVNAMFTNLSRRSQGLIQRQLSLISELESREADPDQLSSLFKLDHLATRMRRNGENLLVLAGEEPGRRWTRPVPLVDVLRAAASEVEQYERIELSAVPSTEVAGRVVNDLVHLLAELLENATSFSSPQTKVKVTGHALPDGRVLIEIHDTGIGLSPEDLAAINERLASPPTVDVSVSRRMGLFVVGRLSQRHGIRIQLRPSDSGGTTALVMLPVDVAQGGKKIPGKPGGPGPVGGPAAAQVAAGAAAARRGVGPGAPGNPAVGGAPAPAGRLGAGVTGPRAALPSRDGGQGGQQGGAFGGPPAPPTAQGRPAPAGAGAFGQAPAGPGGLQAAGTGMSGAGRPGGGFDGVQSGRGTAGGNDFRPAQGAGQGAGQGPGQGQGQDGSGDRGRRPQLPPRGGPRAELPGGNPQPRLPSWSDDNAQPPVPRNPMDAPRGHEEPDSTQQFPAFDDRQGPGSTSEFARPDYNAPRPGQNSGYGAGPNAGHNPGQNPGQFVRSDVFGGQDPSGTGQFAMPGYDNRPQGRQDGSSTGQFERPPVNGARPPGGPGLSSHGQGQGGYQQGGYQQGGYQQDGYSQGGQSQGGQGQSGPGQSGLGQSGLGQSGPGQGAWDTGNQQRQPLQRPGGGPVQPPRQPEPDALPPAGPGDGRTPLFDTLETDWFRGQRAERAPEPAAPSPATPAPAAPQPPQAAPEQNRAPLPPRPATPAPAAQGGTNGAGTGSWRTSPNDELVRQAERVRQPSAGGVTTSGLPRRVPRANLVAGTAQQQQHQAGPQVSRAPDDVRGRLTNLRRGIQQGRQAGTGPSTGSYPRPTHQQER